MRFPQFCNINITIKGDNQALEAKGKILKSTSIYLGHGSG